MIFLPTAIPEVFGKPRCVETLGQQAIKDSIAGNRGKNFILRFFISKFRAGWVKKWMGGWMAV